jgi:hypothetical protein
LLVSLSDEITFDLASAPQTLSFTVFDFLTYGLTFSGARYSITRTEFQACDLDRSGACNIDDVDALSAAIATGRGGPWFDFDGSGAIDSADHGSLLSFLGIRPGDANLDGRFTSSDLV